MSVGKSPHTPRKQDKFDSIMRMWLSIANVMRAARPRIVDCTAGSGWVEDDWGSPVRVLHVARAIGVRDFQLVCIERDRPTFEKLQADFSERHWNLYTDHPPQLHHGDCATILPRLPGGFDPELVYYDPNGVHWPIDAIARFCGRRSDVLFHVSAGAAKRAATERLDSALARFPKAHKAIWVDGVPDHTTGWQWSFVIATNWPALFKKFKGAGEDFHDITTPTGAHLLEKVSTTLAEKAMRDQRPLEGLGAA